MHGNSNIILLKNEGKFQVSNIYEKVYIQVPSGLYRSSNIKKKF